VAGAFTHNDLSGVHPLGEQGSCRAGRADSAGLPLPDRFLPVWRARRISALQPAIRDTPRRAAARMFWDGSARSPASTAQRLPSWLRSGVCDIRGRFPVPS
jgi:hypothetical protein